MIKATCVDKLRDTSGHIICYALQDCNGWIQDIKSDDLKKMIKSKQIEVDNLTLTSDNRLVTAGVKHYIANSPYTLDDIKSSILAKKDKIYNRYQPIMRLLDIDIVGTMYLHIPKQGDTLESVIDKTFKDYKANTGDYIRSLSAKAILNDPSYLVGQFILNDYDDYSIENKSDRMIYGTQSIFDIPILLLHKNNELRLAMIGEMRYKFNPEEMLYDCVSNKGENRESLAIVTIGSDKKTRIIKVGKHISKKESYLLANSILASKLEYWVGTEATRELINKVDKKQLHDNLKSIGIASFAVPFSVVLAIGALGKDIFNDNSDTFGKAVKDHIDLGVTPGELPIWKISGDAGVREFRENLNNKYK